MFLRSHGCVLRLRAGEKKSGGANHFTRLRNLYREEDEMHGTNEVRPLTREDKLQVHKVFYTIQGEGPFSGMPAVFVRFTGCNLRCWFCDTIWDDVNDPFYAEANLCDKIIDASQGRTNLVVFTGGEPARQNLDPIIHRLVISGYQVQIETDGTYWHEVFLAPQVTVVCSPKTAHIHPKIKQHCNHWKYIINHSQTNIYDGLPSMPTQEVNPFVLLEDNKGLEKYKTIMEKFGRPCLPPNRLGVTVWLSPCDTGNQAANERNARAVGELALEHGYRAQVQVHKILGVE